MKTLWLIRHAKSSWGIDNLSDIDRPLNERGYSDAHEMAKRMKKRISNGLIVTSPAIRAASTAFIFARHLGIDPSDLMLRKTLYESGTEQYLAVIGSLPDNHTDVLLFGHNPVISLTANLLVGTTIEEMPTTGIIGIGFEEHSWKKAAASTGRLVAYDFPKNIPQG